MRVECNVWSGLGAVSGGGRKGGGAGEWGASGSWHAAHACSGTAGELQTGALSPYSGTSQRQARACAQLWQLARLGGPGSQEH